MTKLILNCSLVLLLTTNLVFSQNPGGVEGSKYWIMNEAQTVSGSSTIKNILNFHPAVFFNIADSTFVDEGSLKSEFTFFAVFKSKANANTKIAKIKSNKYNIKIYPEAIKINDSVQYQKGDVKKGIMVSFKTKKNKLDYNRKIIFKLFDPENNPNGEKTQLIEFIYYPRMLNSYEQNKVETYLSIKYGISLLDNKPYVVGKNKKIWNKDSSNVYQNRITGLGRLDESKLYQKQSLNNLGKDVVMGLTQVDTLNMLNNNSIANGCFLLWGDDGENFQMSDAQGSTAIKVLKRKWRVQLTSTDSLYADSLYNENYKIKIKDNNIGSYLPSDSETKFVWLAIQNDEGFFNISTSRFLKSSGLEDDYWNFENVNWDMDKSGADLFTVVVATDSEIQSIINAQIAQQTARIVANVKNDPVLSNNLEIFPNPIKPGEEFTINVNFDESTPAILKIDNLVGQQLHIEDLGEISKTTFKYRIYKEGIYLISVITPNQKYFQKLFVKQ